MEVVDKISIKQDQLTRSVLKSVCWTASCMFYGTGQNADWIYEKMQKPATYVNETRNTLNYYLKRPTIHRVISMIIEPVFGCNLHCSYCWHAIRHYFEHKSSRPHLMTEEIFRKAVDQAPDSVESISFALIGEPLLHPNIHNMIRYVSEKGFRTVLYTNGTLLTGRRLKEIAESGVDIISVSTEPDAFNSKKHRGVNLNRLKENVKNLNAIKPDHTEIKLSVVAHHDNADKLYKLREEWGGMIKNIKIIPMSKYNGTAHPSNCMEPWRGCMSVLTSGEVTPCCISAGYKSIPIGNLNEAGLEEIINGPVYRKLLQNFINGNKPDVCQRCTEFCSKKVPLRVPKMT